MKAGFRQSMAWLHTWSGLVVGWLLFAIFLTGTVSYFRPEISLWMRPELQQAVPGARATEVVIAEMQRRAPTAPSWIILMPSERNPVASVFWRDPTATPRGFRQAQLDPRTGGDLAARATSGGDFFYAFHFQLFGLPIPIARWIVSFCAMVMLVSIVSGIVTHRRIFADFFTFRPRKGQRSWLDGHAVLATLALPYHLMITYTGLVTLIALTMPWPILTNFEGNRAAYTAAVFGIDEAVPRAGVATPLTAIAPLVAEAKARWHGGEIGRVLVTNPGDSTATITFQQQDSDRVSVSRRTITFDGTTGAVIATREPDGAADATRGVMYGLHVGRFGGGVMRALFFLSALMGSAMVATGTILWAVKRRQKAGAGAGTRLVEILNVGAIAGLPAAMAVYLLANRLLPVEMAGRTAWEVYCFFIAWAVLLLHPMFRSHRCAWREQLWAGAALLVAVPVVNAVATPGSALPVTLPAGRWDIAGIDLACLAFALLLAGCARMVGRKAAAPRQRRGAAQTVAAE